MRRFLLPLLCLCVFLGACTSTKQNTPYGSYDANPYAPSVQMPAIAPNATVYVSVDKNGPARGELHHNLVSYLQSELGVREVMTPRNADYTIYVSAYGVQAVPLGGQQASSAPPAVVPAIAGAIIGGSIGAMTGYRGAAAVGMSIGGMTGLGVGLSAQQSRYNSYPDYVWQMSANVTVRERAGQRYSTTLMQRIGYTMNEYDATRTLENNMAWAIVRMFK